MGRKGRGLPGAEQEPVRGLGCQDRGVFFMPSGRAGWWMPSCMLTCWSMVASEVTPGSDRREDFELLWMSGRGWS